MTEPRAAGTRLLPALALGVLCVGLALGAHLLSGGGRPSLLTLGQSAAAASLLNLLMLRRRPTVTTVITLLVGAQVALHQWFTLSNPGACVAHLSEQYVPGAHVVPGHLVAWAVLAHTAQACAMSTHPGVGLLAVAAVAHTVAALLSTVVATQGHAMLIAAAALVPVALPGRLVVTTGRPPLSPTPPPVRPSSRPAGPARRRGPPALVLAV